MREGFIVFAPDARGFGERQELASKGNILASSCQWINNMAMPLGQTVTGMWTWDLHRLIAYVETRDDCDVTRLGCAGLSGGGLQTLWATALDERIRCAVVSGYLYGYKESLLDQHQNCSCNYVPHLYEYVDMGDIAALIAPRPLHMNFGELDDGSPIDEVRQGIETIVHTYERAGAPEHFSHYIEPGSGHILSREMWRRTRDWFRTHLSARSG